MRYLLTFLGTFLFIASYGQFIHDINGKPYVEKPYEAYEGSAYLYPDWKKANVKSVTGDVYKDMLVNLDLYKGVLLFFRDNNTYTFNDMITQIEIQEDGKNILFQHGKSLNNALPNEYFEILSPKPLLLKSYSRQLVEAPSYGATTKTLRFSESQQYYLVNNDVRKISLSKSEAENLFTDNWKKVSVYAAQHSLSFKSEESWKQLLAYSLTLQ